MKNLQKRFPNIDFDDLNEKDIIYFCRDALSSFNNDIESKKLLEAEILDIIKSKDWDWNIQDIDRNTILSYPVYNGANSIVKYLLDNKKYDITSYSEENSSALKASILLVRHDMIKNLLSYDIHPKYVHDMTNKAYLSASMMSKKEDCHTYLNVAEMLLEKSVSLNNINYLLMNDSISYIILNNNRNNYPYLSIALHHLVDKYPLDIRKKVFHIKKFFDPLIWKSKKLPQDISQTLRNWLDYHSLQKELVDNNETVKKVKI